MDVYKLRVDHVGGKPIDKDRVESETKCGYPWYRPSAHGRKSQFAVCPACDNPIQLIGLYELPPNVKHPFGKHHGRSIDDLAPLDVEERDNCPYFKPRQHHKSERKSRFEGTPRKILELLISQFDRVVYLLEKETNLRFSHKTLRKMLREYQGERGFMYTGASLRNVPWCFAYMSDATNLYGQSIRNEALASAILAHVPEAHIDEVTHQLTARKPLDGSKPRFFELSLCFLQHRFHKQEDGHLLESMKLNISVRWDNQVEFQDVYEEIIEFNHDFFDRLINTPPQRAQRNQRLLDIAQEELGSLLK